MFTKLNDKLRNVAIVVACSAPVLALAAPADPFDAAIANATDKVESYASALVTLAAVSVIFMIGIKYVKKIRGAA